jgi:hypothetical protein
LGNFVTFALVPVAASCGSDDGEDGGSVGTAGTGATGGTSGNGNGNGNGGCDGIGATTSVDDAHSHFVCVPAADLEAPPAAGATYETTNVSGHTHTIDLTMVQLQSLASGESVGVEASLVNGHTHAVTLVMI